MQYQSREVLRLEHGRIVLSVWSGLVNPDIVSRKLADAYLDLESSFRQCISSVFEDLEPACDVTINFELAGPSSTLLEKFPEVRILPGTVVLGKRIEVWWTSYPTDVSIDLLRAISLGIWLSAAPWSIVQRTVSSLRTLAEVLGARPEALLTLLAVLSWSDIEGLMYMVSTVGERELRIVTESADEISRIRTRLSLCNFINMFAQAISNVEVGTHAGGRD